MITTGPSRATLLVAWVSAGAAVAFVSLWAALQTFALAGSLAGLGVVVLHTVFGHLVLVHLSLILLALLALAWSWRGVATALSGLAVISLAGHGHALAMYDTPSWLLLSEVVHLLAAGAWLGGLLPLAIAIARLPVAEAALASHRFTPLGTVCVASLAGSALFQGAVLVASVPGLIGTEYGRVVLVKLALFVLLLALAARHRFRLTPALAAVQGALARRTLARSIGLETGVGLLAVLAAALLASLPPAMHEQPLWPFQWRPTLETVGEDPAFLREVLAAAGIMLLAALAAVIAIVRRWRGRWVIAGLAAAVAALAAPHLDLLFVPAYPTQYWTSPTGFAAVSIVEGGALFGPNCAACHGAQGRGDGPAAANLAVPPADLTAAHLWAHPDGELFWWLSHGIEGPDGAPVMPGFAPSLSEDQLWALIDWIRANNAGLARAAAGAWPVPVQAPDISIECPEIGATALSAQGGQILRIVFGPAKAVPRALTIAVAPGFDASPGVCVAQDEAAVPAYRTVTGQPDLPPGSQVLVDSQGWLRAVLDPEAGDLQAQIDAIRAHALAAAATGHAGMRM